MKISVKTGIASPRPLLLQDRHRIGQVAGPQVSINPCGDGDISMPQQLRHPLDPDPGWTSQLPKVRRKSCG